MEENNNDALFNLIQGIKEKMDVSNEETVNENNTSNESKNNISDILGNFDISSFLGNNKNSDSDNNTSNDTSGGFDINMIMKIQKIMSSMNKSDPRKNLLLSLKPFLRPSRQNKINEYITYLTIGSALRNI